MERMKAAHAQGMRAERKKRMELESQSLKIALQFERQCGELEELRVSETGEPPLNGIVVLSYAFLLLI